MKKYLLLLLVLNMSLSLPSLAEEGSSTVATEDVQVEETKPETDGEEQEEEPSEFSQALQDIGEYLEPSKAKGKIKKKIAELDIGGSLDLFDLDIMSGMNLAGGYKIEVEPSYADGFYTRVDKWELGVDLKAGDIFEDLSPAYLNISRDQEVIFVRQFKSQSRALKKLPVPIWKMPLTAKKVLDLDPGTFVSIPTKLNVSLGSTSVATTGSVTAKANAFYVISGSFMVHIFRLKDNKVRLRLIATKKRGRGFNTRAEIGFDVFEMNVVGSKIEKVVGSDLLKLGFIKEKGSLFMIDYMMDLTDDKVKKAYNDILSSTYKFKETRLAASAAMGPFNKGKEPNELFVSNLQTAENIYLEDMNKKEKRIQRVFKGTNEFQRSSLNLMVGALNIAKIKRNASFTDNHLTYYTPENEKENLVYTTYMKHKNFKLLFGLTEEKTDRNTFTLFKADEDGNILEDGFSDYGMSFDAKDKHLHPSEQKKIQNYLKINLPEEVYNVIEWDKLITEDAQRKARVYYRVLFKESTIANIMDRKKSVLKEKLYAAQQRYKEHYLNILERLTIGQRIVLYFQRNAIVKKLHKILSSDDSKMSRREKVEKFVKLQRHPLFSRIGLGFMFSLLDEETLKTGVEFQFKWSSDQVKTKRYSFGKREDRPVLNSLEYIQSALNNRSFDLRLVGYDPATELTEEEVVSREETARERRARETQEERDAKAERVLRELEGENMIIETSVEDLEPSELDLKYISLEE